MNTVIKLQTEKKELLPTPAQQTPHGHFPVMQSIYINNTNDIFFLFQVDFSIILTTQLQGESKSMQEIPTSALSIILRKEKKA